MRRVHGILGVSAIALIASGALSVAQAQETAPAEATIEEVVVTGSFIRGTPEDAALPVDTIGADELQRQGSPSTVDLIKALPTATGSMGETNQFDARSQGAEGAATVNLRGLGASRTLVLVNGRRLVPAPTGAGAPDINLLPMGAIGRIEVLKEGAAATYGSDAIAGVVNFITRKNLNGFEANATYSAIRGSTGDYSGYLTWGGDVGPVDLLLSASYQHRSELSASDRKFTNPGYYTLPEAWSSGGNPTTFIPVTQNPANGGYIPAAVPQRDAGCAAVGGLPTFIAGPTPVCAFNFNPYSNLVEEEDRYQLYGEANWDISANAKLHVEGLYSKTEVPHWATSPSYLGLTTPSAATNPILANPNSAATIRNGFFVPATNPGFAIYRQQNPGAVPAFATGAYFPGGLFRPLGVSGNPIFGGRQSEGSREHEGWRISAALSGDIGKIGYDTAVTYMQHNLVRVGNDVLTSRMQLALRGLGGANCTGSTPGANGCQWLNPFSNAIPANAITGQANPNYSAAAANDPALVDWLFESTTADLTSKLFVYDLVFNGETPLQLAGGPVRWAAGVQYRRSYYVADYNDLTNLQITPCVDSPSNPAATCAFPTGPFTFLGGSVPADLDGHAYAAFGELSLPISDTIEAQLAARYEDYGKSGGGSTFDPKLTVRWQISDPVALRASFSSTFRAPPLASVDNGQVTTLQPLGGQFRAVDIAGNPGLDPESAFTYSVGAIVKAGGLKASLDYWSFDFKNPIITEPVGGIYSALFPASGPSNCANPAFAGLVSRFTFQGACSSANISRIRTSYVNGPGIKTSGVDLLADWDSPFEVFGGELRFGGNVTYVMDYSVDETVVEGITVSPAFQGAGRLNFQTQITPVPRWKAQTYAEFTRGPHNLRIQLNHIGKYRDTRTTVFAPNTLFLQNGQTVTQTIAGQTISSNTTVDVVYRAKLPWDTTAVVGVINVTDEAPPFARLELGYDPFTGNPVGRTVRVSLTKRF